MKRDTERLYKLLEYSITPQQTKYIQAVIDTKGNVQKAARSMGLNESTVRTAIKRASLTAAKMGDDPDGKLKTKAPAGFSIDRVSSFLDEDGVMKRQWVIANRDKEDSFDALREAWAEVCQGIERVELIDAPGHTMADLLCDYSIGDAHMGMYAYESESGEDWSMQHAVEVMRKASNHLVSYAPPAHTAYILDVGDYFHSDNQNNETSGHKNKLDVDGRWSEILNSGVSCMIEFIDLALQKHAHVIYRSVVGNHNDHSAVMMNMAIKMRYHDEPRLTVLDNPGMYNYYQFGTNLLADTHGHTIKAEKLPLLMAVDEPQMWATTTNRVWRTGHVHHMSEKEYPGCNVVTYRTMAPKDAWHAGQGYRSNREMQCTIYHKENGRVGASYVNPSML